jgi:hypothetical protein
MISSLVAFYGMCGAAVSATESKYVSNEGRFKVYFFQKEPTLTNRDTDTQWGSLKMKFVYVKDKNNLYMVSYCDYPAKAVKNGKSQKVLDNLFKAASSNGKGKMQYVRPIRFNGLSGREFQFESGAEVVRGRAVFMKTRFYQWQVIANAKKTKSPLVDKFLGSFETTD